MDGFELRSLVLSDGEFSGKCVPYIFLSTSENPENIAKAFQLSASGYFKKEGSFSDYKLMIAEIIAYWKRSRIPLHSA